LFLSEIKGNYLYGNKYHCYKRNEKQRSKESFFTIPAFFDIFENKLYKEKDETIIPPITTVPAIPVKLNECEMRFIITAVIVCIINPNKKSLIAVFLFIIFSYSLLLFLLIVFLKKLGVYFLIIFRIS